MKKEMKDFDLNEKKEFNVRDCCAVFNDGQWKRGMVECVNSQNYQVYLVDFGKSDIIPENHIKPLPDSVIQFPMLAYRLQLRSIPIGALVTSEQRRKVTEIQRTLANAKVSVKICPKSPKSARNDTEK